MPQDYHIYIHGVGGGSGSGGSSEKTKPFEARLEKVFGEIDSDSNEDLQTIKAGVAALGKVAPWVAAAIVVAKATDKVLTIGFGHLEEYTGNYQYSMEMNNFKTIVGALVNPISMVKYSVNRQFQMEKANKQIAEQNKLFGQTLNNKVGL